jgi:hypothetical protein
MLPTPYPNNPSNPLPLKMFRSRVIERAAAQKKKKKAEKYHNVICIEEPSLFVFPGGPKPLLQ